MMAYGSNVWRMTTNGVSSMVNELTTNELQCMVNDD